MAEPKFKAGDMVQLAGWSELEKAGETNGLYVNGIVYGDYIKAYIRGAHKIIDVIETTVRGKVAFVYRISAITSGYLPERALSLVIAPKNEVPSTHKWAVPMSLSILGTEYKIRVVDKKEDNTGGYCDPDTHTIILVDLAKDPDWKDEAPDKIRIREQTILRHEIVHAFLNESGLRDNAHTEYGSWAHHEEMVDWIACQGPKIVKVWEEAGVCCND